MRAVVLLLLLLLSNNELKTVGKHGHNPELSDKLTKLFLRVNLHE